MKKQTRHIAHIILIIMILLSAKSAKSQANQKNYEIEARAHFGYLYFQNDLYHSALSRYSGHAPGFEFSLHRNTYGQHRWEVLHNYPSIGMTFYYSPLTFNNNNVSNELGNVFALYPFINFPFNKSATSQVTFKLGVGVSYLTNKFHPTENYHNFAIGSHVNAAVNLSFEYRQRLFDRLTLVTSAGLTHFSNGATHAPNMGINIFSAATGFSWYLRPPKSLLDRRLRPVPYIFEFDGRRHFVTDVQYTIGYKDVSQQYSTNDFYLVHDFAAQTMLQLTERDRLGVGVEFVIDNSDRVSHPDWNRIAKVGGLLSYEMMLDRLSFMFNVGIRNNEPLPARAFLFYQKVGARYYFWNDMFATIAFTTYDIRADFISIGLGYHFKHKYYLPRHEKKPHRSPVYPR